MSLLDDYVGIVDYKILLREIKYNLLIEHCGKQLYTMPEIMLAYTFLEVKFRPSRGRD